MRTGSNNRNTPRDDQARPVKQANDGGVPDGYEHRRMLLRVIDEAVRRMVRKTHGICQANKIVAGDLHPSRVPTGCSAETPDHSPTSGARPGSQPLTERRDVTRERD